MVDFANDVEAAYRRGFQQGAHAAVAALQERGMPVSIGVRDWVGVTLFDWRYEQTLDRTILPPAAPVATKGEITAYFPVQVGQLYIYKRDAPKR